MGIQTINHWTETVEPSVLEQYKGSVRWLGILKSIIDKFNVVDNDAVELSQILKIDSENPPTGYKLEWIASLVNLRRKTGETDSSLLNRVEDVCFSRNAGTADRVIKEAADESGDTAPVYFEEEIDNPVVFVYTPNGSQLKRSFVNGITPTGVLGVPAAKIKLANGKFLRTVGEYNETIVASDNGTEYDVSVSEGSSAYTLVSTIDTGKKCFVGVARE